MKEDIDNIDDEADEDTDEKRGITYQVKIPFLFVLFNGPLTFWTEF